jgi:AbrB family looped-hinge helix DNA binding protein
MAHSRYTVKIGERGRFVLPAEVRRSLHVGQGDLLVLDVDAGAETFRVRKASDLARDGRGLLRGLAPGGDLVGGLIRDRRTEAESEETAHGLVHR